MILITIIVLSLLVVYFSFRYTSWKRQNIPTVFRKCFDDKTIQKCGKVFGSYDLFTPVLVITKPELIHQILVEKSGHFSERKIYSKNEKSFQKCIFFSKTNSFQKEREVIGKVFSNNKNLIELCKHYMKSDSELIGMLSQILTIEQVIDLHTFTSMYLMRKYLSSSFGTTIEQKIKEKLFSHFQTFIQNELTTKGSKFWPNFLEFGSKNQEIWKDFTVLVEHIYDNRKVDDCKNSLLFMLSDANETKVMNKRQIIENTLMFCIMGFKTSLTVVSHLIHVLATNQSIQQKLIKEIDKYVAKQKEKKSMTDFKCPAKSGPQNGPQSDVKENVVKESAENEVKGSVENENKENVENVINESDINEDKENVENVNKEIIESVDKGKVENVVKTEEELKAEEEEIEKERQQFLDDLKELSYLDACIQECLRLYPPVPQLRRIAIKNTAFDEVYVPKNCHIIIPVNYVQRDRDNYSEPLKFKPERFLNNKVVPGTFIPFGDGIRECAGIIPALLEIKLTMINMMTTFRFVKCSQTKELDYNRENGLFSGLTQNEVSVKVIKRNKNILD